MPFKSAILATAVGAVPAAAVAAVEAVPDEIQALGWLGSGVAFAYTLLRQLRTDRNLWEQVHDLRAQRDTLLVRAEEARAQAFAVQQDLHRETYRTMQAMVAVQGLRTVLQAHGIEDEISPVLEWAPYVGPAPAVTVVDAAVPEPEATA